MTEPIAALDLAITRNLQDATAYRLRAAAHLSRGNFDQAVATMTARLGFGPTMSRPRRSAEQP
jgi:hypothetical protein